MARRPTQTKIGKTVFAFEGVRLWLGMLLVAALVMVMALVLVSSMGEDRFGPLLLAGMIDRCVVWFLAAVVTASACGWGLTILVAMRLSPRSAIQRLCYAAGLGLGLTGLYTLGIGAMGWIGSWWSLGAFLVPGVVLLLVFGHTLLGELRRELTEAAVILLEDPLALVVMVMAVLVLGAVVWFSYSPPLEYDVTEYHLGAPAHYYRNGHIGFIEHNVYSNFPFQVEMLYLASMVLEGDAFQGAYLAGTMNIVLLIVAAVSIWSMVRRFIGRAFAPYAMATLLTLPWFWLVSIRCYVENGLTLYVILSLCALCDYYREDSRRYALLAGLFGGLAMGCKYPAGFFLAGVAAAIVLNGAFGYIRAPWRKTMAALALFVVGAVAAVSPWLAKNAALTGNPVYPQLSGVFPSRDWDARSAAKWDFAHTPRDFRLQGHTVTAYSIEAHVTTLGGALLTGKTRYPDEPFSPVALMCFAPLALLWTWRSRRVRLYLIVALVGLASWFYLTHRIGRFLVPYIPVAILLGCEGMKVLEVWAKRGWAARVLAAGGVALSVLLVVVSTIVYGGGQPVIYFENYERVVGPWPGEGRTRTYWWYRSRWDDFEHIANAARIARDDRLLLVGESRLFFFGAKTRMATPFDRKLIDEAMARGEDPAAALRREGIRYVFCNWGEFRRLQETYTTTLGGQTVPGYSEHIRPELFETMVEKGDLRPVFRAPQLSADNLMAPVRFTMYEVVGE